MGYKLRPVVSNSAGATLEVPQEVIDDIEAMYAHLRANPGQEVIYEDDGLDAEGKEVKRTDEEKAKAAALFMRQAQSYGKSRPAGALKVRQLPSKHLAPGVIRLNIVADVPANGARQGQTGPVEEPAAS